MDLMTCRPAFTDGAAGDAASSMATADRISIRTSLEVSVTDARARVRESTVRNGYELPIIRLRVEGELQHTEGLVASNLAVRAGLRKRVEVPSPDSDYDLPDSTLRVGFAVRVLEGEALIVVLVTVQHELRAGLVESPPNGPHLRVDGVGFLHARAEQRMVPIGERAGGRVGLEVRP